MIAVITVECQAWQEDPRAVASPWVVKVDGNEAGRASDAGASGDLARRVLAELTDAEVAARIVW